VTNQITATAIVVDKRDRKSWRPVRFGDIVREVNKSERDPIARGPSRSLGLEHLDPEVLRVSRWGSVADGTSFTRTFSAGQVLFGKRRAYQRKVAVPNFDGVCSGDILVLEPTSDELSGRLLPFVIQSEPFFRHALSTSAGSLSPRTKFSSLANFGFLLPPREIQDAIAELLWSVETFMERLNDLVDSIQALQRCIVIGELRGRADAKLASLAELLVKSPESGHSAVPSPTPTGHFVLSLGALSKNGYVSGNLKPVRRTGPVQATVLRSGDFLVSRSNTAELVGLVGIFNEGRADVSFPDTIMRLHLDETRIDKEFLELVMLSPIGRLHMRRVCAGTSASMKKINRSTLGKLTFPCPDVTTQRSIVEKARSVDQHIQVVKNRTWSTHDLKLFLLRNVIVEVNGV